MFVSRSETFENSPDCEMLITNNYDWPMARFSGRIHMPLPPRIQGYWRPTQAWPIVQASWVPFQSILLLRFKNEQCFRNCGSFSHDVSAANVCFLKFLKQIQRQNRSWIHWPLCLNIHISVQRWVCSAVVNECQFPHLNDCHQHALCRDLEEGYECKCHQVCFIRFHYISKCWATAYALQPYVDK